MENIQKLPKGVSEAQYGRILNLAENESDPAKWMKAQAVFAHLLTLYVREQQELAFHHEDKEIFEEGLEFINSFLMIGCL